MIDTVFCIKVRMLGLCINRKSAGHADYRPLPLLSLSQSSSTNRSSTKVLTASKTPNWNPLYSPKERCS